MINSTHFSQRIQKIMKYYDLNASLFAEKIQVGRSSISHILSGRNKPSLDFVINIVNTFPEVDLYWLLNGTGSFPKHEVTKINETPSSSPDLKTAKTKTTLNSEATVSDSNPTLITKQNNPINTSVDDIHKGKKVSKIIVLYSDGTFKDYLPE